MSYKFRVTVIESERGWGQKTEYQYFDTVERPSNPVKRPIMKHFTAIAEC